MTTSIEKLVLPRARSAMTGVRAPAARNGVDQRRGRRECPTQPAATDPTDKHDERHRHARRATRGGVDSISLPPRNSP